MECNKEEAIRAKGIAEKKMQNSDFEGARKIALKAQQLFPELENISQLLAVCNVHCSAQNKIHGAEKDWYGILQVERMADEATIKKQYRRLALVLHPDKNQHPGAEAAFKLIGEANMVLSDQGKRSLYDNKCRVSVRTAASKPPPHQANRNPYVRKQFGAQNSIPSVPQTQFGHQPTQPGLSNGRPVFWTCCPFCNIKYQYYRDLVNRALRCQNCLKPFIAYDLGAQGVPLGSNWGQPGVSTQTPNQGASPVGFQGTAGFQQFHMGSQGSTAEAVGGFKNKGKEDEHVTTKGGKKGTGTPNFVAAKPRESKTSRNTSRKKGRKLVVESSESCDTSSSADIDDVVVQENGGNPAGHNTKPNDGRQRRSSRQKQRVSYNENISDDDFVSPPKRSRGSGSSRDSEEEQKEAALDKEVSKTENSACSAAALGKENENIKLKGSAGPERSLPSRNIEGGKDKIDGEAAVNVDPDAKLSGIIDDSESISTSTPDPEYYECPDPEFSDFDKVKEESCFAVDQIWACYDSLDGMPRFYARIRKVFSPEFKLKMNWLEGNPEGEREIDWLNEGLPVACGKFVLGDSEETADRLMFSHQVQYEKGSRRCSYVVYPREGEIWALFKDWDITWSSDPENHKKYNFEIVEVLSDFVEDAGVSVAYLDKLAGFVSLFERTTRKGFVPVWIPSSELLRFSHQIPSFRMTGMEREGVPEGSFELDPASLPSNLFELCHSGNVKMETESKDAKVSGSCPKSPEEKVEFMMGADRITTPKKNVDFEGKGDFERETSRLRRSPRESGNIFKKHTK